MKGQLKYTNDIAIKDLLHGKYWQWEKIEQALQQNYGITMQDRYWLSLCYKKEDSNHEGNGRVALSVQNGTLTIFELEKLPHNQEENIKFNVRLRNLNEVRGVDISEDVYETRFGIRIILKDEVFEFDDESIIEDDEKRQEHKAQIIGFVKTIMQEKEKSNKKESN